MRAQLVKIVGLGKIIGLMLIAGGLIVGLVGTLWLLSVRGEGEGNLTASGLVFGLALLLIVLVLPMMGLGGYLTISGRQEERVFARLAQERAILDAVLARGQARVVDLALELNLTRDQVRDCVYDLVGKGLFTGYINWNEGVLYAREASQMQTTRCPNCGGERELVGKGIVRCPYCGSELFIT